MNSLIELWNLAISPVNIVFTVLLGVVIVYWIIVLLGMLDFDLLNLDADGDGEIDGGWSFLKFLHAGEVPVTIIGSALIASFWITNLCLNFYLNPAGSWLIAIGLWIPGLMLAAWLTRLVTAPARKIFRVLEKQVNASSVKIVGMVCEVTSTTVDEKFGTAKIETAGAPLLLNIRAGQSESLGKGDKALVISEDPEKRIFKVRKYTQPEETN